MFYEEDHKNLTIVKLHSYFFESFRYLLIHIILRMAEV